MRNYTVSYFFVRQYSRCENIAATDAGIVLHVRGMYFLQRTLPPYHAFRVWFTQRLHVIYPNFNGFPAGIWMTFMPDTFFFSQSAMYLEPGSSESA